MYPRYSRPEHKKTKSFATRAYGIDLGNLNSATLKEMEII
jgi:hypothetical protein